MSIVSFNTMKRCCRYLWTIMTSFAVLSDAEENGRKNNGEKLYATTEQTTIHINVLRKPADDIARDLIYWKVIPDLLDEAPKLPMQAEWVEGPEALFGNEIDETVIKREPYWVCWKYNSTDYYTMILTGIDEKAKKHTLYKETQFCIVGNVKEYDLVAGEYLTEYLGPKPAIGWGDHRYVFLVYKQPEKIEFKEPKITASDGDHLRTNFSSKLFAEKYNLGKPIAVNFFRSKHYSDK